MTQPSNFWQNTRVRLRAIEPSDAEMLFQWSLDSQRAQSLDFTWPPTSLEAMRAWALEQSRRRMENDTFHWVIEDLQGTPVGTIDTHHCSPHSGTFSYAVDIVADQRGKGYASEAVRMVLRYYFEELRYQKVTVNIHADNPASIRLHEKLGFQCEGRLRRTIYSGGKFTDELMYGLTVEEFHSIDMR